MKKMITFEALHRKLKIVITERYRNEDTLCWVSNVDYRNNGALHSRMIIANPSEFDKLTSFSKASI